MKPSKGAEELASRLMAASTAPLVHTPSSAATVAHPEPSQSAPAMQRERAASARKAAKGGGKKESAETFPLTLRPTRELHARYVAAAIKRSQEVGRVISAQEIMLEVLERGSV